LEAKQDTLISGTNIKTINNQPILGEGNIEIEASSASINLQDIEPYLDGQWTAYVGDTPNLIGAVKYEVSSARETVEIDLSSYLPDDGHDYEVLVGGEFTTGTTVGSVFKMFVSSSIATAVISLGRQIANVSNKGATGGGNAIVPIATDRKLFMKYNCTGSTSGNTYLTINSYRRLGKPIPSEGV
jgi:hypothetical protein